MKVKSVKAPTAPKIPLAIKLAHEAAERANISNLHAEALKAAYEHGYNDAVEKAHAAAHALAENAKPAAKTWLERWFE